MKKMIKKLSAVVLATALTVTMFVTGQEAKATSHDFRNAYGRTVYTVGCTNDGGLCVIHISAPPGQEARAYACFFNKTSDICIG